MTKDPENNRKRFTFKKEERLCSKKQFDKLFSGGNSFLVYQLKIVFIETEYQQGFPAKAAFTVSKKLFKRAVKRNLLKRRMLEAYRLNKQFFYEQLNDKKVAVVFIFIAKEILDYSQIERALKKGLKKLVDRTSK